jgi:hypothetical protein
VPVAHVRLPPPAPPILSASSPLAARELDVAGGSNGGLVGFCRGPVCRNAAAGNRFDFERTPLFGLFATCLRMLWLGLRASNFYS